jgi:hypothetical protein
MQTRIRNELNRGTTYDADIRAAIESAIQYYRSRRFVWNQKRAYTSTSAGQEYYVLPSDCLEIDMIRITYTSGDFTDPLDEVTYRWIEDHRHNVNYRSEPEKFAMQGEDLRLWPVPDNAYRLDMTFLYEDNTVSASASDGATSSWMTTGEEMIRMRAKADVLANVIRGPQAEREADRATLRERDVYKQERRRANRLNSSGHLRPHL